MTTYAYAGHETVGAYVKRQLDAAGWEESGSIETADAIITYFTHASAIEDAYFDDGGIIKCAREDALLIDLSPSTLSLSREISAVATVSDLIPIEAPIAVLDATLDDAFAMRENIICFVSGDKDAIAKGGEVLKLLAGMVRHCGTSGKSQLSKAAYTMQFASQFIAAVESEALVRAALEVDDQIQETRSLDLVEPLSDLIATALPAIGDANYKGTYTVEMMMADVVAAMTVADDASAVLPHLESTMKMLEMLAVIGGADLAPAALTLLFRDEETCSKAGLDWSRIDGLFVEEHDNGQNHEPDIYEVFEEEYGDFNIFDDGGDGFDFDGLGVYSEH
ncbi:MAG: NAD(P)-dependent oxidoreductase [Eggerthellaceae bacterium]|nr:NAD(P)-dependent oxidoreductase [Eggerthellaceae bacterium]